VTDQPVSESATAERQDSDKQAPWDTEIEQWARLAVRAAEAKLGERTEAFFVGDVIGITDWFVVTSGANTRQVRAIVDNVEFELTKAGGPKPLRIEGLESMQWVLIDFGAFVVHVFDEEGRQYYELERLWNDVPRLSV